MNAEYPVFPDDVFKGSMIWATQISREHSGQSARAGLSMDS